MVSSGGSGQGHAKGVFLGHETVFHATRAPHGVAEGVQLHYCGCDIQLHSVIEVSDASDIPVVSDEHATAWDALYVRSIDASEDPNCAPTEIAPSTPATQEGEPSMPETPRAQPDQGDPSPEETAIGVATRGKPRRA